MRRIWILSSTLAVAALLACGGGGDSNSNGVTGPGLNCALSNGTFTATVNGAAWSACQLATVRRDSTMGARDTTRTVSIAASGTVSGNLTYALVISVSKTGPWATGSFNTNTVVPALAIVTVGSSTGGGWGASLSGGTGTITITTITNHQVSGTFTADAAPVSGSATGTLQVRNGVFNLTF